jgi:hypothetical protein
MRVGAVALVLLAVGALCILNGCASNEPVLIAEKTVTAADGAGIGRACQGGGSISPATPRENGADFTRATSQVLAGGGVTCRGLSSRTGLMSRRNVCRHATRSQSIAGIDRYSRFVQNPSDISSGFAHLLDRRDQRAGRLANRGLVSKSVILSLSDRRSDVSGPSGSSAPSPEAIADRLDRPIRNLALVPWLPSTLKGQGLPIK